MTTSQVAGLGFIDAGQEPWPSSGSHVGKIALVSAREHIRLFQLTLREDAGCQRGQSEPGGVDSLAPGVPMHWIMASTVTIVLRPERIKAQNIT